MIAGYVLISIVDLIIPVDIGMVLKIIIVVLLAYGINYASAIHTSTLEQSEPVPIGYNDAMAINEGEIILSGVALEYVGEWNGWREFFGTSGTLCSVYCCRIDL